MKYYLKIASTIALGCIMTSSSVTAQHMQGIGISFGANDFYGPQTGKYLTDNVTQVNYNVLTANYDTITKKKFRYDPLVRFTYWYQLNKMFDFSLGLSLGNATYPGSSKDSNYIDVKQSTTSKYKVILAELDARINWNILDKTKYFASPYIFAGLTASHHPYFFGADIPLGAGVNLNLSKDHNAYLNFDAGYKVAITNTDQNHLQYAAGFVYWFKPHYKAPEATPYVELIPPPDMDHDGVTDSIDKCPTIPGLAQFSGCPDTDGDGIPDNIDECPLVAGSTQFNGCPDTDGDGIPDQKDKCPYLAGQAQYNGCPPPDRDHDGVLDDVDRCPDVAGTVANQGCPEIQREIIERVERAARSVFFETGKAKLKKISYKSLDQIVAVMNNNPTLKLDIGGYTDNVGSDEINAKLSDDRANACRDYIISKGVSADRITAKGHGKDNPVADNKTALGRAQNRRTEFKLRNY